MSFSLFHLFEIKANNIKESGEGNLLSSEFCLVLSQQYRSKREYLQSPRGKFLGLYEFYIFSFDGSSSREHISKTQRSSQKVKTVNAEMIIMCDHRDDN